MKRTPQSFQIKQGTFGYSELIQHWDERYVGMAFCYAFWQSLGNGLKDHNRIEIL